MLWGARPHGARAAYVASFEFSPVGAPARAQPAHNAKATCMRAEPIIFEELASEFNHK